MDDLHFNTSPGDCRMTTLVQKTDFQPRAWRELLDTDLVEMTSKILFDSKTNFKTISLCVTLSEAAICCDLSPPSEAGSSGGVGGHSTTTSPLTGLDWIRDFFTVIEYPVVGYVPPGLVTNSILFC